MLAQYTVNTQYMFVNWVKKHSLYWTVYNNFISLIVMIVYYNVYMILLCLMASIFLEKHTSNFALPLNGENKFYI